MSTLLLRLAAPLQSLGVDSKFERRATSSEPTKSGVIGLIAAALGRRRNEPLDDLAQLQFGVRVDKPGQVMVDFHTARSTKQTYVTRRHYLEDASFLVGLEGDGEFLQTLENAINSPYFPLFLGRRSFPPTGQLFLGVRSLPLKEALQYERFPYEGVPAAYVFETSDMATHRQRDLPISFSQEHRKYAYRNVDYPTMHDALESLGTHVEDSTDLGVDE